MDDVTESVDADELIYVPGLRPIEQRRIEAMISTGTHGTQHAALRAVERRGRHAVELTGAVDDREAASPNSDVRNATYGAEWMFLRGATRIDVRLSGALQGLHEDGPQGGTFAIPTSTHGARIGLSRTFATGGFGHELALGAGLVRAVGSTGEELSPDVLAQMKMTQRTVSGEHRFLDAYLKDTIRVIDSLDISGGFIVENWRFLNGTEALVYGISQAMDLHYPKLSEMTFSPQASALYRASDQVAVRVRGSRSVRAPALGELYRPLIDVSPNVELRPERAWMAEGGPEITAGPLAAGAVGFVRDLESPITNLTQPDGTLRRGNLGGARAIGIETFASWRPAKAWTATVGYTFASSTVTDADDAALVGKRLAQAPRQRASAMVTFDDPRIITLSGAVRYLDRSWEDDRNTRSSGAYALVDAVAARKLVGGLAGFVAIENLLDRRYRAEPTVDTPSVPRTFHLGVRLDTARF